MTTAGLAATLWDQHRDGDDGAEPMAGPESMPKTTDTYRVSLTPPDLRNYEFPVQPVGTRVAIRGKYDGVWSRGFVILDVLSDDGRISYRICRTDGSVLPAMFAAQDVIPDRG